MLDYVSMAASFGSLLDRTVGTSEGSVVPYDLASALDRVEGVSARLLDTRTFSSLGRRSWSNLAATTGGR